MQPFVSPEQPTQQSVSGWQYLSTGEFENLETFTIGENSTVSWVCGDVAKGMRAADARSFQKRVSRQVLPVRSFQEKRAEVDRAQPECMCEDFLTRWR